MEESPVAELPEFPGGDCDITLSCAKQAPTAVLIRPGRWRLSEASTFLAVRDTSRSLRSLVVSVRMELPDSHMPMTDELPTQQLVAILFREIFFFFFFSVHFAFDAYKPHKNKQRP